MMATFTGFEPYRLREVRVTPQVLGHGSYATVLELEYMGLKCAGKKIHEVLLQQGDASYGVRRFEEECRLLSQVRHPNIVQFLGVYFQEGVRVPILVMEFLPTNLTSCIERYGILPEEISYSILHDVALGLCYLHGQTPPIIHRDLSSNNVLLTPNMTAKISDLGVARILNLTPLQVSRMIMTQTPGTPAYMPPEVMIANPKYDVSVDGFSYGILMIHMFSARWPEPQVGPIRTEEGRLIPVSEAERREEFLHAIGNDHPLMDLIHRCVSNDARLRPHAGEIVRLVSEVASQFPASFANRLEMLRQIEAGGLENGEEGHLTEQSMTQHRCLDNTEENTEPSEREAQMELRRLERDNRKLKQSLQEAMQKSAEMEKTTQELTAQIQANKKEIEETKEAYSQSLSNKDERIQVLKEKLVTILVEQETTNQHLLEQNQNILVKTLESKDQALEDERIFNDHLGELERDKAQLTEQLVAQQREYLAKEIDFYKKSGKSKNLLKKGFKKLKGMIQDGSMSSSELLSSSNSGKESEDIEDKTEPLDSGAKASTLPLGTSTAEGSPFLRQKITQLYTTPGLGPMKLRHSPAPSPSMEPDSIENNLLSLEDFLSEANKSPNRRKAIGLKRASLIENSPPSTPDDSSSQMFDLQEFLTRLDPEDTPGMT